AVSVSGVSKRYALGETHTRLLSEKLTNAFRRGPKPERAELWALNDVTFDLPRGEVLGIIGRNGAGKSTLLKILSRITAPSHGRALVRGRLASLLEVGTGFHPELTGRENIYLNGTILGMRRREIDRKFDEIVAFSEVELFLDTPVKRYSSGMYVRLAFAVAAHLDPGVLVVDEVLAVGDREFQNKCLGRLDAMSRESGRTVLLVSHNLDAIQRLCHRAIVLRDGRLDFDGSVPEALERYVSHARSTGNLSELTDRRDRYGSGTVIAAGFEVRDESGAAVPTLMSGGNYRFMVRLMKVDPAPARDVQISIEIRDPRNITVMHLVSTFTNDSFTIEGDSATVSCTVRDLNLAAGEYSVTLFVGKGYDALDCIHHATMITVAGGDYFGTGSGGLPEHCRTLTRAEWSVAG
ncbi:MAG TPA: ABC transporter ATP-binding protein, partial [Thermoanaerobaculia bacterium]|nr:ABC transporter ATP-binding protein [Thermoanaerobaculia bacterium]